MFIDIYNKFSCKFMKFINKYNRTVCKYLNWLEFQIPAFRAFCKTDTNYNIYLLFTLYYSDLYTNYNIYCTPCTLMISIQTSIYIVHPVLF